MESRTSIVGLKHTRRLLWIASLLFGDPVGVAGFLLVFSKCAATSTLPVTDYAKARYHEEKEHARDSDADLSSEAQNAFVVVEG